MLSTQVQRKGCGCGERENSQRKDESCGSTQQGPALFTPQPESGREWGWPSCTGARKGGCWPVMDLALPEPAGPSFSLTSKLGTDKRYGFMHDPSVLGRTR